MLVGERSAHDARVVAQFGGDDIDRFPHCEVAQELRRLAAHAAAQDDPVGPEIALQRL
jgi:hypothetical protein